MKHDWNIDTDRLRLRKLVFEDVPFVRELVNDPDFIRYIGDRNVHCIEDAQQYLLSGPLMMYEQHNMGLLLVSLKQNQQPIGMCGLLQRDYLTHPDIGFAFLPEFRTAGYALEAAKSVIHYARQHKLANQICAMVSPDNLRSIALLGKLGLSYKRDLSLHELDKPTQFFID